MIDYFHDMSLLRNGDDDSINFQKASCTLDGCVKIWTSRVDSVATETGKLLSGLAEDGRESPNFFERDYKSLLQLSLAQAMMDCLKILKKRIMMTTMMKLARRKPRRR